MQYLALENIPHYFKLVIDHSKKERRNRKQNDEEIEIERRKEDKE